MLTRYYWYPHTVAWYRCTLLFKINGIYFSNAYLIDWSSVIWSKLLTWHLSGVLWGRCEISYAYNHSSRLYDQSKSVWCEKRDIKSLATGTVFGGYFIIRDRLLWKLKLFLFHGIEMKLVHKITLHRRSKVSVQAANENMSTIAHKTWLISNDWMAIMLHGYALLKITYLESLPLKYVFVN